MIQDAVYLSVTMSSHNSYFRLVWVLPKVVEKQPLFLLSSIFFVALVGKALSVCNREYSTF